MCVYVYERDRLVFLSSILENKNRDVFQSGRFLPFGFLLLGCFQKESNRIGKAWLIPTCFASHHFFAPCPPLLLFTKLFTKFFFFSQKSLGNSYDSVVWWKDWCEICLYDCMIYDFGIPHFSRLSSTLYLLLFSPLLVRDWGFSWWFSLSLFSIFAKLGSGKGKLQAGWQVHLGLGSGNGRYMRIC